METKFVKPPLPTARSSLAAVILPMPVSDVYNPYCTFQKISNAPRIGGKHPAAEARALCHTGQGEKPFDYCPAIPIPCPQKLWVFGVKGSFIHSASITMTIKVAPFPLTVNVNGGLFLKADFL